MKAVSGLGSLQFVLVLLVAVAAGAVWCWLVLADSRQAALAASEDLAASRELAGRIETLRRAAAPVGSERPERELRRRIDDAAREAGIGPTNLATIQEQPSRRLADSGFQERPTQVLLREVNLRQAIAFFHAIATGPPTVEVKSLRIWIPREQDVSDRWTADAVLTRRLYLPKRSQDEPLADPRT